jgi:adiponectin receptor
MLIVGTLCAITAMNDKFHTPQWRPVRASVFIGLGMFSIFPLIHGTWLYGYTALEERMGLRWSWLQSTLYILGCGFFASCVPERWYPGRYDLVGASHQIFHFCALAAATAQLKALLTAFDHLHGTGETIGHY